MARRSRQDEPGSWHHVINRAIARRSLFEDRVDVRFFLSRLAREVRRGRIEIHAWCVLTTHFHLLLRSPRGELAEGMRRAQNEYVRFFNRRHRRDGPLVRGRFLSKRVGSLVYRRTLVRYIDHNPVQARLAEHPWEYPWASAAQFVHGKTPPWLARSWVEDEIAGTLEAGQSFIQGYIALFGSRPSESAQQLVESRVTGAHNGNDDLDDLVNGTPDRVREWMHRKARLADGHSVGLPVCGVGSILSAFQEEQTGAKPWKKIEAHPTLDPLLLAELGLLRILAGATWREISQVTGKPLASCHRLLDTHKKLTLEPGEYAERVAWVTQRAARLCHD